MWQFSSQLNGSPDQRIWHPKRQSTCQLEGDAIVEGLFCFHSCWSTIQNCLSNLYFFKYDSCIVLLISLLNWCFWCPTEILNQKFKLYSSLSQTDSDVKMVRSLIPIWEVCFILILCHPMFTF